MGYVPKLNWAGIGEMKVGFSVFSFQFFGGEGQQGVGSANIEDGGQPVAGERGGQS
jgi:hypothetical protein